MGRPTGFKQEQLLGDVTTLFWRKGFFSTSIADLVSTTGLNPGSLYNSFGNKLGLLDAAVEFYGQRSIKRARKSMNQYPSIERSVEAFFQLLIDSMLEDPDAKGCFLVNTWLEMAAHEEAIKARIQAIFDQIEQEFCDALSAAVTRGELNDDADPVALAKYLMMTIWGLRVMGRMNPDRAQLEQSAKYSMIALRVMVTRHDFDLAPCPAIYGYDLKR